jgi:hypothetical protein
MAMSKRTELATARRKLHQFEEHEPAFRIPIAGMKHAEQRKVRRYFRDLVEKQRKQVETLEAELDEC